jgi:glycosyltransferase involved in cell wall biosynthesis
MRILHVIPGLTRERGGPSVVVEGLVRHQSAVGHQVAVLTTDQGVRHGEHEVPLPSPVTLDRASVCGPDRLAYAPGYRTLVRTRLGHADVVHVHSIFTYPVHVTLREAAAAGVPVLLRPCGQLHRYSLRQSRWLKWAYLKLWGRMVRRSCTAWHYTSQRESAESWPWDDSPRFVLPNGIEPAEFAVDRHRARQRVSECWPQLGDAPYVLFLGRLHPKKRLDLLLEAFLTGAPTGFKLIVAGPDVHGLWPGLAGRWLATSRSAARVLRVGALGGDDKINLLAGANMFALPSEHENFGIAALEALAAGTRVLLSPHVDLAEAVVNTGWGEVLPLEPQLWRNRFAALSAEVHQAASICRDVAARYSWSRIAQELEQHYLHLKDRSPRSVRNQQGTFA